MSVEIVCKYSHNYLNARTLRYGGEQGDKFCTRALVGLNLLVASKDELSEFSGELSLKSTRGRGMNRAGESA